MKKAIVVGLAAVLVTSFVLGIANWLAGPTGTMLGVAVVIAIAILFGSYLDLYKLPAAARSALRSAMVISVLSIIAIWGFGSVAKQFGSQAAPASFPDRSGFHYAVGEHDEVMVKIPPFSWFDIGVDKPVVIRRTDNKRYEKRPDGSIYKIEAGGKLKRVSDIGKNIPGSAIYILAKKGEKMVNVTVSTVRK